MNGDAVERLEISGSVSGTALVFAPTEDGRLRLTVEHFTSGLNDSVILRPGWLRPMAAWLVGDSWPGIVGHGDYSLSYGSWLAVLGDETAAVYNARTRAELTCRLPYGTARVAAGPRNRPARCSVMISPEARAEAAWYLRRIDAGSWAGRPVR